VLPLLQKGTVTMRAGETALLFMYESRCVAFNIGDRIIVRGIYGEIWGRYRVADKDVYQVKLICSNRSMGRLVPLVPLTGDVIEVYEHELRLHPPPP